MIGQQKENIAKNVLRSKYIYAKVVTVPSSTFNLYDCGGSNYAYAKIINVGDNEENRLSRVVTQMKQFKSFLLCQWVSKYLEYLSYELTSINICHTS